MSTTSHGDIPHNNKKSFPPLCTYHLPILWGWLPSQISPPSPSPPPKSIYSVLRTPYFLNQKSNFYILYGVDWRGGEWGGKLISHSVEAARSSFYGRIFFFQGALACNNLPPPHAVRGDCIPPHFFDISRMKNTSLQYMYISVAPSRDQSTFPKQVTAPVDQPGHVARADKHAFDG